MTGILIDPRVNDVVPEKLISGFSIGTTSPKLLFVLWRVLRKTTSIVLPVSMRILKNSSL